MIKKILIILGILSAVILQISLFSAIPFLNKVNFVLFIVLYLSTRQDNFYILAAIFGGAALDFYSSFTFGTHLAATLAVVSFINYAYFKILVGHRFLSFIILMNIGIFSYHLLLWTAVLTLNFLKIYPRAVILTLNFRDIFKEAVFLTLLLSAAYLAFKISQKKIKEIVIPIRN